MLSKERAEKLAMMTYFGNPTAVTGKTMKTSA